MTPMTDSIGFQPASDRSLIVRFSHKITTDSNQQVRRLLQLLESEPVPNICNLNPSYCSLLISFDALKLTHEELEIILRGYVTRLKDVNLPEPREMEIPVCYGGEFGPDLNEIASLSGMTPDHAIELHMSVTYTVYFLGFVPGFAYLGELPTGLATPRLPRPRRSVPPGSVGIAGTQTGVYPIAVPGGWRLIGRTPTEMFRKDQNRRSLLSIGDRVRFTSISDAQFRTLRSA